MRTINNVNKIPCSIEIQNNILDLETDKILIKPLNLEELTAHLKRLTSFQYPFEKKNRVYRDIVSKNTIYPKISLKNYYNYPAGTIDALVKLIWDTSVEIAGNTLKPDYGLNAYLIYEEIRAFSSYAIIKDVLNSENISKFEKPGTLFRQDVASKKDKKYTGNKIIDLLNDSGYEIAKNAQYSQEPDIYSGIYLKYSMNFPLNISGLLEIPGRNKMQKLNGIERLIELNKIAMTAELSLNNTDLWEALEKIYKKAEEYRVKESSKLPAKLLVLVEGATEEKLLPIFSQKSGVDFDRLGISIISAGGKNQVARIYKNYYKKVNLPIFILLDADALTIANEIKEILRDNDRLYIIPDGEFEDILPVNLICRAINSFYNLAGTVNPSDITEDTPRTKLLDNLWKENGYGEFSKSEFSGLVAENIRDENDISPVLRKIINIIEEMSC